MKWYLTQSAINEPRIDIREDDEDLRLGFSLLAELARSDETLVEIEPGVWRHSKAPGESAH